VIKSIDSYVCSSGQVHMNRNQQFLWKAKQTVPLLLNKGTEGERCYPPRARGGAQTRSWGGRIEFPEQRRSTHAAAGCGLPLRQGAVVARCLAQVPWHLRCCMTCTASPTAADASTTSRKNGFRSTPLVPKQFDPRLIWALVPVQMKMWARKH
jgi:hypothetical protein